MLLGGERPRREPPLKNYTRAVRRGAAPLVQMPGLSGGPIIRSPYEPLHDEGARHSGGLIMPIVEAANVGYNTALGSRHPDRIKWKRQGAARRTAGEGGGSYPPAGSLQSLVVPGCLDGTAVTPQGRGAGRGVEDPLTDEVTTPPIPSLKRPLLGLASNSGEGGGIHRSSERGILPMPTRAGGFSRLGVRSNHMNRKRYEGKGFLETSAQNSETESQLMARVQQSRLGLTPPPNSSSVTTGGGQNAHGHNHGSQYGDVAMMSGTLSKIPRDTSLFVSPSHFNRSGGGGGGGGVSQGDSTIQLTSHPAKRLLGVAGLPMLGTAQGGRERPPPAQMADPMTLIKLGRTEFFERTHPVVDSWTGGGRSGVVEDMTIRTIQDIRERKAQRADDRRHKVNNEAVARAKVREQQRPYSVVKQGDSRPNKRHAIEHVVLGRLVTKLKQNGDVSSTDLNFFQVVDQGMNARERGEVSNLCRKPEDFNHLRDIVQVAQQEIDDEQDANPYSVDGVMMEEDHSEEGGDLSDDGDDGGEVLAVDAIAKTLDLVSAGGGDLLPSTMIQEEGKRRPVSREEDDERFVRERQERKKDATKLPKQFRRITTSEMRSRTLSPQQRTHDLHEQQLALGKTQSAYHQLQNQGQQYQPGRGGGTAATTTGDGNHGNSRFNTVASNLQLTIQQSMLQRRRGPTTIGINGDGAEYNNLFSRHEVDALCTIFARAKPDGGS